MSIYLWGGVNKVKDIYIGNKNIGRVYKDNNLIYIKTLMLFDNGVVSDKLGKIDANRVITQDIQGDWSFVDNFIIIHSYRNQGQMGGRSFSIDFLNKITEKVYKEIHIEYDIVINSTNPQNGGGVYIDILRSENNYIKQINKRYNENGTFINQELVLNINDVYEDFYIAINSYCFSNAGQFSTTVKIKKLWLNS